MGVTPPEPPARPGTPQPPALHPFIHSLTRVLPRQLRDLFVLEDEARRAQPEPDYLGEHSGGSQEQRGPRPPPAHSPLHPTEGSLTQSSTGGSWGLRLCFSQPPCLPRALQHCSPATAVVRLSLANQNCSGSRAPPPRVVPFPRGNQGARRAAALSAEDKVRGRSAPTLPTLGPLGRIPRAPSYLLVGISGGETQKGPSLSPGLTD